MSEQRYIISDLLGRWFLGFQEGYTSDTDEACRYTEDELVKYWDYWDFLDKPVVRVVRS